MRMTWSELLFAHWCVEPEVVRKHLPPELELDTYQGSAWVGVVPFLMSDTAPRCCPAIPGLSKFLELNVRTYVTKDGKPGVWFFSLDANNAIAVRAARTTFHLPYMDARMSLEQANAKSAIHYESRRTHRNEPSANFIGSYEPIGDSFHAQPNTFEHWLTARYCLYSANKKGEIFRGEINHPPWTLRNANCEIQENTMGHPYGFDFTAEPNLLYADAIKVQGWWATRC